MVIQPKKNGKARRTVDLSGLSRAGQHESHHTRSPADIAKSVPANMLKSVLDCVDGYHGVELDPRDGHKTTFSTECGYSDINEYLKDICLQEIITLSTQTLSWKHARTNLVPMTEKQL